MNKENDLIIFDESSGSLTYKNFRTTLNENTTRCLAHLIKNEEMIVSNTDLLNAGWGSKGLIVSDASVRQAIAQIRKSITESGYSKDIIINVPRKGYRLSPGVIVLSNSCNVQTGDNNDASRQNSNLTQGYRVFSKTVAFTLIFFVSIVTIACLAVTAWWQKFATTTINNHYYVMPKSAITSDFFSPTFQLSQGLQGTSENRSFICNPWHISCHYFAYLPGTCLDWPSCFTAEGQVSGALISPQFR